MSINVKLHGFIFVKLRRFYRNFPRCSRATFLNRKSLNGFDSYIIPFRLIHIFQKISSLVRLIDTPSNNLIFNYKPLSPNCINIKSSGPNECPDVGIGEQVDFEVSIKARFCPTDLPNAEKR